MPSALRPVGAFETRPPVGLSSIHVSEGDIGPVPDSVENFIRKNINSVEQLEVLILLRRQPDREWSPREVAQEMRSTTSAIELRLEDLVNRRLAKRSESGTYSFAAPAKVATVIDETAGQYSARRTTIIQMIFSAPSDSVRSFADAFRLRSEDEE